MDLAGNPISILDEVITHKRGSIKGMRKMVVIRSTAKGVRVEFAEKLISIWGESDGQVRLPHDVYVIGPFVPPDIHFIQSVNNLNLRLLMLEAWELRNNIGVV